MTASVPSAPFGGEAQAVKCPSCQSPHPHRHPAVQFEGEVEICTDDFHLTPTAQNKPEYIAQVHEKRNLIQGVTDERAQRGDYNKKRKP